MMKDIKNCFKLLKYGYQIKTNIVCAVFFFLLGVAFSVIGHEAFAFSVVYFFLAILFVIQSMYMGLYSDFIGASPKRRKVELRYIDILNVMGGIIASAATIITAFLTRNLSQEGPSMETNLVIGGWMVIILYCYMCMSFKMMWVGMLIFLVSFFSVMNIAGDAFTAACDGVLAGKTAFAVIVFLAEVAIGIVLGHVIRRILYRKSMSRWAMGAKLRMEQS